MNYTLNGKSTPNPVSAPVKHSIFKMYFLLFLIGGALLVYLNLQSPAPVKAQAPLTISYSKAYTATPKTNPVITAAKSQPQPQCSLDSSYRPAGPVSAGPDQTGLIQTADSPYSHKMYGVTAAQLKELSLKCPLAVPDDSESYINAYTSYWIGWQLSYAAGQDGLCRVSDANVLLHTSQAFPSWQNASLASAGLKNAWQAYLSAVTIHENGHLQLDVNYARSLLTQFQNFPPTDCGTIAQTVNAAGDNTLALLRQANIVYDSATQNGALQGAIVP